MHGPGVLTPDEETESAEVMLEGPGTLASPKPEAMDDAEVVYTDEILDMLDTVRGGVGGCPKYVRPDCCPEEKPLRSKEGEFGGVAPPLY